MVKYNELSDNKKKHIQRLLNELTNTIQELEIETKDMSEEISESVGDTLNAIEELKVIIKS